MMIINSLDTNVVYDIVYTKRNRNSVAMDFYKKFRNLELTVTSTVKEECVKVLIKYSTMFATDLTNFLNGHNALGKHWDDIEVKGKSNLVNDFEKSIQNKSDYKVIHPFYQNIIKKIKQSIIFMNTENINGYLLELPATMQEYLLDSIDNMFTTILPNSIANGFMDTNKKFETLLKGYFNSNESSDLKILVTLIMLVIAGDIKIKKIDSINFYTSDLKFKKNYSTIHKNKTTLFSDEADIKVLNNIHFSSIRDIPESSNE